jgi:3-hydroxyisobutyrate dehydrogenase-like beta-hydroxyacid dehydrogenase
MDIGFIGIGVMGLSMARNLMKQGHRLFVYTRTAEKARPIVEEGAQWCDSVADCAGHRDAVITMVGYPKDVEEVYFSERGILASAAPGCYLIDMTTTDPDLSVAIAREAEGKKMYALDAPVSGGDSGAKAATLSIMVGGRREDFDACLPLFQAMGKNIVYEGGPGTGQHTKMANQIALAGAIAGVCEALSYGKAQGLDLQRMLDSIGAGAAGSWQMSNMAPRMLRGDMNPGFYIKHYIKDMTIAERQTQKEERKLAVLDQVLAMYEALAQEGMGDLGTQALIRYYQPVSSAPSEDKEEGRL